MAYKMFFGLFCRKQREENRYLTQLKNDLAIRLGECEQEKQEANQQFLDCVQQKIQQNLEYQEHVSQLNEEVHRLRNVEIMLEAALAKSVVVPDISEYIDEDNLQVVTPHSEPDYIDYELYYADLAYYVFPYDTWIQILSHVHVEIEKVLISWVKDISDCDNFAFSTADVVSLAFKKLNMNKQGAFPIIWSWAGGHAYNGFVTESDTYIYEPQNNTVIGKLGETTGSYESELILFPQ
jgi:hypothetical protein